MNSSKSRILVSVAATFLTILWPQVSYSIDYILNWEFEQPIGVWQSQGFFQGDLIYDPSTGGLRYQSDIGRWNPPDVGSFSGQFKTNSALNSVPLSDHEPWITVDEVFGGQTVVGSNAVRIGYDSYKFWPSQFTSPLILRQYGLSAPPTSYDYGQILTRGLSQTFLESDLYAIGSYQLIVIPEPDSISMVLFLFSIACLLRLGNSDLIFHSSTSTHTNR